MASVSLYGAQRPWTQEEDDTVRRLVAEQRGVDGANRWAEIAKFLPGRNGKQCRERCARILRDTAAHVTIPPLLASPGRLLQSCDSLRAAGHLTWVWWFQVAQPTGSLHSQRRVVSRGGCNAHRQAGRIGQ